jgi:hypothetical protein
MSASKIAALPLRKAEKLQLELSWLVSLALLTAIRYVCALLHINTSHTEVPTVFL